MTLLSSVLLVSLVLTVIGLIVQGVSLSAARCVLQSDLVAHARQDRNYLAQLLSQEGFVVDDTLDMQLARARIALASPDRGVYQDQLATLDLLGLTEETRLLLSQAPLPRQRFTHTNGSEYTAMFLANVHSQNFEKYPPIVVYHGDNGLVWARPLSDWSRSMTNALVAAAADVGLTPEPDLG